MTSESIFRTTRLCEIADGPNGLVDGPFGSNLPASLYTSSGVPVIRGSNLSLGRERFKADDWVYVSEETASTLARSIARPGDIVFTKKGTLGQTGFIPLAGPFERYLVSSNQMKLTVRRDLAEPLFVYYAVSTPDARQRIVRESTASGVPKINVAYLREFEIPLPPIEIQQVIASLLGSLDGKIELNRRMNRTIEELASTLFKSWFVDFDPVQAKRSGLKPVGVPKSALSIFPEHFEDSELGPIPKGWRATRVGEEFRLAMGQSPPGSTYNETGEGLPFYQGKTDFTFRYPTRRVYCTAPTRFADPGDTLVSVRAPVGETNMASERCAIGRGIAAVRHKSGSRSLTYYAMQALREEFTVFEAEGTLFGAIGGDDFRRLPYVAAPPKVVSAFDALVAPLDDRIEVNEKESGTLSKLRDTLLPALLSGEVTIKQAEKAVTEVA